MSVRSGFFDFIAGDAGLGILAHERGNIKAALVTLSASSSMSQPRSW
jgi:hypothetical protein